MIVYAPKKYKVGARKWFSEIFRVHSREEYAEFFSRGFKKEEGTHRIYPWFYSRVFLLCFIVFAAFACITTATAEVMNYIGLPTVIFTGAILVNIPFMVLLYELYPKRDFSFFTFCLIMIICSTAADALINLLYCIVTPENKWLSILNVVLVEETGKALPALVALFVLKKKDPLQCLLIGASVGIGMSVYEDMGYIFFSSLMGSVDMGSAVSVTLLRSLTSFFGHVIWTGFIGWAFGKFNRPLLNVKFWGMYLLSLTLHYIWDFPVLVMSWIGIIFSLIVGTIIFVRIIGRERYNIFYPKNQLFTGQYPVRQPWANVAATEAVTASVADDLTDDDLPSAEGAQAVERATYSNSLSVALATNAPVFNGARIAAAVTSLILGFVAVLFCLVGVDGGVNTYYFNTKEELIAALHEGNDLRVVTTRGYDINKADYSVYKVEGETVQAVQIEVILDIKYYYTYSFDEYYCWLESIEVELDGEKYICEQLDNGEEIVYFFRIMPNVEQVYYDFGNDMYEIITHEPCTLNKSACKGFAIAGGVVLALGAVAAATLALAQRKKKQ